MILTVDSTNWLFCSLASVISQNTDNTCTVMLPSPRTGRQFSELVVALWSAADRWRHYTDIGYRCGGGGGEGPARRI